MQRRVTCVKHFKPSTLHDQPTTNNVAADAGRLQPVMRNASAKRARFTKTQGWKGGLRLNGASAKNRVTSLSLTGQITAPTDAVETTMATSCTTALASHIVRIIHESATPNARLGMLTSVIAAACAKGLNHFVRKSDDAVMQRWSLN